MKKIIFEIFETFVVSLAVILVLYMWIALPEQVWGQSMEPTFHTGERILVEKVTKHFKDFERGDVIVLNPPNNSSTHFIKRLVGMPGEKIKISDCKVYIYKDQKTYELEEPYIDSEICTTGGPSIREGRYITLGENEYWVLGDNRDNSADSRYFGVVEKNNILGKAVFRFWPINKAGFL